MDVALLTANCAQLRQVSRAILSTLVEEAFSNILHLIIFLIQGVGALFTVEDFVGYLASIVTFTSG